jgi:hypothetical protein
VAPRQNYPNGSGPTVEVRKQMPPFHLSAAWDPRPPSDLETNLPEGPMPANVKDFKLIELRFAMYKIIPVFNIKKNQRTKKNCLIGFIMVYLLYNNLISNRFEAVIEKLPKKKFFPLF